MAAKAALAVLFLGLLAIGALAQEPCPNGTNNECNDSNECTDDVCVAGTCQHTATVCDDGIDCTVDTCDVANGCSFTGHNSLCDDNNACTSDVCRISTGGCQNNPNPIEWCDDGNDCTDDLCLPESGCKNVENDGNCDDGDSCTADRCDLAQGCVFESAAVLCDDELKCTVDLCDQATGCFHVNVVCNDNIACTTDECNNAAAGDGCVYTPEDSACNDNNACTTDACSPTTGCSNTAISCDDNNDCSVDSCDAVNGCQHADAGTCDDGNQCTNDSCLLVNGGGCIFTNKVNGAACNDVDACTTNDQCIAGTCTGTIRDCDDGNQCTDDSCNSATGCINAFSPAGDSCTDGGALCDGAGNCVGCRDANDCDDNDACTVNRCLADHSCDYSQTAFSAGEWTEWTHCNEVCNSGNSYRYRTLSGDASCAHTQESQTCNNVVCTSGMCARRLVRYREATNQLVTINCPANDMNGNPTDDAWCATNVAYVDNGVPYWKVNNINDGKGESDVFSCIPIA